MVPFLRDHDNTAERAKAENEGREISKRIGRNSNSRHRLSRRELSWNNYSKPIS
jgi:hypothetical protein